MNLIMNKVPRWESVCRPAKGYLKDTFSLWKENRGVNRGVVRRGVIGTAAGRKMRVETYLNGTESMYFLLMVKTK